jgi:hypothetical protein
MGNPGFTKPEPRFPKFLISKRHVCHSIRKAGSCHVTECEPNTGLDLLAVSLVKSAVYQFPNYFVRSEKDPSRFIACYISVVSVFQLIGP